MSENSHALDVFAIRSESFEKIEGEDRWDVGANFFNEQSAWLSYSGEPPHPKIFIEFERQENKSIDWIGIGRHEAARHGLFPSIEELAVFIEKGESDMRKTLLESANAAIDFLLEKNRALSARLHNDRLNDARRVLHNTGLMKIAVEVQKEYWPDIDANPKQEVILAEIREKYGFTEAEAKAVERVACPKKRAR